MAAAADTELVTDAAERLDELDGIIVVDLHDDLDEDDDFEDHEDFEDDEDENVDDAGTIDAVGIDDRDREPEPAQDRDA